MPSTWSNKRERQYEKIKRSTKSRGKSTGPAKRIAAATVNKTRKRKGETKGSSKSRRSTTRGSSRRTTSTRRKAAARKGGRASARARSRG
ncbi:MAG: hypothetical protein ACJ79C_14835 [Myxococcales bacterium]